MIARSSQGAQQNSISVRRRLPLLLLACAVLPAEALAQSTMLRVDLSGTRMRYNDSLNVSAASVTPELTAEWPLAVFRAVASYSQLSGGGSSAQGSGGFSLYTPAYAGFSGELEGFGGGSRTGEISTSQLLGVVRGHLATSRAGAWVGGGMGAATNTGVKRPSQAAEFGAWLGGSALRGSVSVAPTVVDDTIKFTDVNLAAVASSRRLQLSAFAGSRSGSHPEVFGTAVRAWGGASLVSWITSTLAIVASAGRYPVDLTQGFPGGTYGSVGLRMAARLATGDEPPPPPPSPVRPVAADAAVGDMRVAPLTGGRKLIFIRVADARRVDLAGDFSDWQPLPMTRRPEGWWSIELPLASGSYEVGIRIDGGAWQAPPGLMTIRDEFQGEGGLLIVP